MSLLHSPHLFLLIITSITKIITPTLAMINPSDIQAINACASNKFPMVCLNGGTQYAICAGQNTKTQNVQVGTICLNYNIIPDPHYLPNIVTTMEKPPLKPGQTSARWTDAFVSVTTSAIPQASQYCLQGGVLAGEGPKYLPDECIGDGPIACRGQYIYTSCNIGPSYKCRMPGSMTCHMWHNGEWIEA